MEHRVEACGVVCITFTIGKVSLGDLVWFDLNSVVEGGMSGEK